MRRGKYPGFMARTHAVLSILLLSIVMIIPLDVFKATFWQLKSNWLLYIVALVITVGGALLPDLDNVESKALHACGPLGSIFMVFMQSTSSIVWNVYHMKGDMKPFTQHRYLWHTPIIGIGMILMFYFGLPAGDYTIFNNIGNSIKTGQFLYFLQTNAVIFIFILLSFMAALAGSSVILGKISKIINIPSLIKYIFPLGVLVYIGTATYTNLRLIGLCLGAGYLFHILEDVCADSGVPLFFPIPAFWCKKVWYRVKLPITVKTGGVVNTIIDFIGTIAAVISMIVALSI